MCADIILQNYHPKLGEERHFRTRLRIFFEMNSYELTRRWFDFAFEKQEAKVQHTALFCWIVELNNRLGWKQNFGIPTNSTMEGLSIGNKGTYLSALNDLESWGFIKIIKPSKNQYQSCIISICYSKKATALHTALDTALQQQCHGIDTSIDTSIVPIDKQINKETNKHNKLDLLNKRQKDFYDELTPFVGQYEKEMIRAFYNYWSEQTSTGFKMRKETEKTWETKKRLENWNRNNLNKKQVQPQTSSKTYISTNTEID